MVVYIAAVCIHVCKTLGVGVCVCGYVCVCVCVQQQQKQKQHHHVFVCLSAGVSECGGECVWICLSLQAAPGLIRQIQREHRFQAAFTGQISLNALQELTRILFT